VSNLDFLDTISKQRSLFERILGKNTLSNVVATNQLITVWGTQGGVGCSTVTAVLAKMLHQYGFTVIVLETTPTGGSFLRCLSKKPVDRGIDTIVHRDRENLNSALQTIRIDAIKGLSVLPRSGSPANTENDWSEEEARALYHWAKKQAAFVLVDAGGMYCSGLSRVALSEADRIVAVVRGTQIGNDFAIRFHEIFRQMELDHKIIWMLNQAEDTDKREFEVETGLDVSAYLGWNKDISCLENGDSVPKSAHTQIEQLLGRILNAPSSRIF